MSDLQIPSGFISVCKRAIKSDNIDQDKNSDLGQLLKSAFMSGPSKAVATFGKVLVSDTDILEEPDDDSTNSSSNNSSSESYNNYTIAEAYLRYSTLHKKYEDEATSDDNAPASFTPGAHIYVMSLLPNEGCTKWHLLLDASVEPKLDDIKAAINSKKFKLAYQLASANVKSDGLIVISAETFLNPKAACKAPFIGNCQYAFDSGSSSDNVETQTVCLAIAPLSAKTKKPKRETVYKVTYNITGDITDGELDELMSLLKAGASDNSNRYDPDEATDQISQYLHGRLKCKGDSSTYKEFLKIREYIAKNIDKKSLELNEKETETPQSYSKVSALGKDLISY